MEQQNILFIVWDSCRLDASLKHAPTLNALRETNLTFEHAISPGLNSLPAHVSMFTGKYPHEHGILNYNQSIGSTPLLTHLMQRGYRTYGISANGFASPSYDFDEGFDNFLNTQGRIISPAGLDVYRYVQQECHGTGLYSKASCFFNLMHRTFRHHHPSGSLMNITSGLLRYLISTYPILQSIPHRRFSRYHDFCYDPNKNTKNIQKILEQQGEKNSPFFIFANYMDPHHPYSPPKVSQDEFLDRSLSYPELSELAEKTNPWKFITRVERGDHLSSSELEIIRKLYAGEISTVDAHLNLIIQTLKEEDLFEDTLIVITSDHGENLGETDRMGETKMGHVMSASENVLRVPLVIAHPQLDHEIIGDHVSIKDIYSFLTSDLENILESGDEYLGDIFLKDQIVSSQIPGRTNPSIHENHPQISDQINRSISVCYQEDWKLAVTTTGQEYAWRADSECPPSSAPDELYSRCINNLSRIRKMTRERDKLSKIDIQQLESLGYL